MSGESDDGVDADGSAEPQRDAGERASVDGSADRHDSHHHAADARTDGGSDEDESDEEADEFEFGRVADDTFESADAAGDDDPTDPAEDTEPARDEPETERADREMTEDDEEATDETGAEESGELASDEDRGDVTEDDGSEGAERETDADASESGADGEEPERQANGDGAEEPGTEADADEPERADDEDAEDDENEPDGEADAEDAEPDKPEAKTDGEGYVGDRPTRRKRDRDPPDPDEDVGGISTPPDDEEMPLADHIEEMMLRLAAALLVGSAMTALGILIASDVIGIIWDDAVPVEAGQPHVYHPLELWLTRIKVAALAGVLFALPTFVYQCYLFMRPGLYPHERKYYLASVPFSLVLGAIGMFVSYWFVLPLLFRYFTFYAEGSAEIAYGLGETFNLIVVLTAFMAVVFQIPLFITLAIMMGVTTRRWLADKRLYFWAAFFGISFMFSVDLTMTAPIVVGLIMIGLFEGTLLILKWVGKE